MIITYLIKSTLCFAVLFGFYKIVLEAKALHHFKRYYLLVSLIFSLTIPLITFTYTTTETPQEIWIGEFAQTRDANIVSSEPFLVEEKTNYLPYILWSIYGLGVLVFGGRFLLNLIRLKRKITIAEIHDHRDFTLALLQQSIIPHSFLKYIFLSQKRYENKEIPPEVIAHEATHVRQKHSLDILFIEFLQVVFWFNPLFWITKKSITLNHEFLADQGAIQEQHDIYQYQHILLHYASSTHHTTLESPFNYSSTKKRILMLSQSFNRKRLALSALLLIPIILGCLLVFNQGIIAQPSLEAYKKSDVILHARSIDIKILDNTSLEVDNIKTSKKNLQKTLESLHTDLTKEQRDNVVNIHVSSQRDITYKDLVFIQKVATTYGYHRIVTPYEEIVRSKGNTPMADRTSLEAQEQVDYLTNSYAKEFIKGAHKNGKKAILIVLHNNKISINGENVALKDVTKNINTLTKDWEETDYTGFTPSVYKKNVTDDFLKKVNKAYNKTHLSKANGSKNIMASFEKGTTSIREGVENGEETISKEIVINDGLSITISKASVTVNGIKTSLADFAKTIDKITAPWEAQEYTSFKMDISLQDADSDFIKKLNKEYKKTKLYKANPDGHGLVPPPPPPPPAPNAPGANLPPPSAPMNNGFIKAHGKNAYPTKEEATLQRVPAGTSYVIADDNKSVIAVPYDQEVTVIDSSQDPTDPPSKDEIKAYNALAKKYNVNPTGQILKDEVAVMFRIYNRMTLKQKKKAQPYPAIAPPPSYPGNTIIKVKESKNKKKSKNQKIKYVVVDEDGQRTIDEDDIVTVDIVGVTPTVNTVEIIEIEEAVEPLSEVEIIEIIERGEPSHGAEVIEIIEDSQETDLLIDLREVIKKGATFYYNDKKISTEEAKEIVKKPDAIATINVKEENGKTIVYMRSN